MNLQEDDINELPLAKKVIGKKPAPGLKGEVMSVLHNLTLEEHFDLNHPPLINKYTSHEAWIKGTEHIQLPEGVQNIFLHPIREDGKVFQYVGYVRDSIPDEHHHNMKESFFIIDGSCTCRIDQEVYDFSAGDYFELPLHSTHNVKVTSAQPLKAVLQRVML